MKPSRPVRLAIAWRRRPTTTASTHPASRTAFAQAALHLSEYRKMEPGPVEEWLFYDHPSGWHRIHRAMVWKAEHVGAADIAAYDAAHPAGAAGFAVSP